MAHRRMPVHQSQLIDDLIDGIDDLDQWPH